MEKWMTKTVRNKENSYPLFLKQQKSNCKTYNSRPCSFFFSQFGKTQQPVSAMRSWSQDSWLMDPLHQCIYLVLDFLFEGGRVDCITVEVTQNSLHLETIGVTTLAWKSCICRNNLDKVHQDKPSTTWTRILLLGSSITIRGSQLVIYLWWLDKICKHRIRNTNYSSKCQKYYVNMLPHLWKCLIRP